jgi:hypothetical protein
MMAITPSREAIPGIAGRFAETGGFIGIHILDHPCKEQEDAP